MIIGAEMSLGGPLPTAYIRTHLAIAFLVLDLAAIGCNALLPERDPPRTPQLLQQQLIFPALDCISSTRNKSGDKAAELPSKLVPDKMAYGMGSRAQCETAPLANSTHKASFHAHDTCDEAKPLRPGSRRWSRCKPILGSRWFERHYLLPFPRLQPLGRGRLRLAGWRQLQKQDNGEARFKTEFDRNAAIATLTF